MRPHSSSAAEAGERRCLGAAAALMSDDAATLSYAESLLVYAVIARISKHYMQ